MVRSGFLLKNGRTLSKSSTPRFNIPARNKHASCNGTQRTCVPSRRNALLSMKRRSTMGVRMQDDR